MSFFGVKFRHITHLLLSSVCFPLMTASLSVCEFLTDVKNSLQSLKESLDLVALFSFLQDKTSSCFNWFGQVWSKGQEIAVLGRNSPTLPLPFKESSSSHVENTPTLWHHSRHQESSACTCPPRNPASPRETGRQRQLITNPGWQENTTFQARGK